MVAAAILLAGSKNHGQLQRFGEEFANQATLLCPSTIVRIANRATAIGLPNELIANVGAGHSFSENDLFTLETMPGSGVTQAQRIIDFIGVALLASECLRQQGVIDGCDLP